MAKSNEKNGEKQAIVLSGLSLPYDCPDLAAEAAKLAGKKLRAAGIHVNASDITLCKKSVDARKKDDIRFVCAVNVALDALPDEKKLLSLGAKAVDNTPLTLPRGSEKLSAPPIVVGMGPAGLFCALLLAENGFCPILIDRGDCVADRVRRVETFTQGGELDPDSNIQFGAGGAGTFSDGKLLTRINDPICSYVLSRFYAFGAPAEILTEAKPHIGTDVLRGVVNAMLARIASLGGRVIYRCRMDDIAEESDGSVTLTTNQGVIRGSLCVLAPGHSARDTYEALIARGFLMEAKPLSVGVRIEHLAADIDKALYGACAGDPRLHHAEYALSDTKSDRGVYTFCMCPGGTVVSAASERGGLVVNGMSDHGRNGKNSNSALVVSVGVADYEKVDGSLLRGAIAYQRAIERAAFAAGGSDYRAPIQTVGDFLSGRCTQEPRRILPTYGDGRCRVADLSRIFPDYVTEKLRYGLHAFDRKIGGFACPDAVLTGAETRTSAPIRILRGEDRVAIGRRSVYPCGEGAGYAGGITSAGTDGVKTALAILSRYLPQ